jgi:hypothetical protein
MTAAGLVAITGGSWLAAEGRWPWQPRPAPARVDLPAARSELPAERAAVVEPAG